MRGNPKIIVECDECGTDEEVGMTPLARGSFDERNIDGDLKSMGWIRDGDRDICPDCWEAKELG